MASNAQIVVARMNSAARCGAKKTRRGARLLECDVSNVARKKNDFAIGTVMTNHSVRARMFVEKFLQDAGAEADSLFKCDLENAIEELLDEVTEEAEETTKAQQKPLVWKKASSIDSSSFTVTTLRPDRPSVVVELISG